MFVIYRRLPRIYFVFTFTELRVFSAFCLILCASQLKHFGKGLNNNPAYFVVACSPVYLTHLGSMRQNFWICS